MIKLKTTKKIEVSSQNVPLDKVKLRKIIFSKMKIDFRVDTQDYEVSYNKSYLDTRLEQVAEIVDDIPTGNTIEQEIETEVFFSVEKEIISSEQYEGMKYIILVNFPDVTTSAEINTILIKYGIPKFIEQGGFYKGLLTASDFEIIEN